MVFTDWGFSVVRDWMLGKNPLAPSGMLFGTGSKAPAFSDLKLGSPLEPLDVLTSGAAFPGTGYIQGSGVGVINKLGSPTMPFTWEQYVKTSVAGSAIGNKMDGTGDPQGINFQMSNGSLYANLRTSGSNKQISSLTGNINDGNWHHVALIRNTSIGSWRFAVDGVLSCVNIDSNACTDDNRDVSNSQNLNFMMTNSRGGSFFGSIEEIRISNINRYSSDFVPSGIQFPNDANTLGLWHLNEITTGSFLDSSSNTNNGLNVSGTSILGNVLGSVPGITTRHAFSSRSGIGYTVQFEHILANTDVMTGSVAREFGMLAQSGGNLFVRETIPETELFGSTQINSFLYLNVQ
jgi:hypothetical protein